MPKKLIICCDGTWNTPDRKDRGRYCPSNVVHMARAVAARDTDGQAQVVFYDAGVGTGPGLDRWTGGAFGHGLDKNIEDAYRFIIHNYEEGDLLYFFGFSRGAYTARSVTGLIRNCGILPKEHAGSIPEAFKLYRSKRDRPDSPRARQFIGDHSCRSTTIAMIGVWDTVGALGIPVSWLRWLIKSKYEFHDVALSSYVQNAFHALAIDEQRKNFLPTLWTAKAGADQTVKQVWFSGVHSNIGGGYADAGLSDITFIWMKENAEQCGLKFDEHYISEYIHPDAAGELRDSRNGLFKWLPAKSREIGKPQFVAQSVDNSVLRRRENIKSYHPKNLLDYLKRTGDSGTA